MLTDAITVKLRLDGLVVLAAEELPDQTEVAARFEAEEAVCPRCRRPTWQVHEWRRQRKRDAKLWGKPVWILLWKRRFRCRACRDVFTEDDPACGRRRRTTYRLRRQVASEAEDASVKAVSRWHGVSEGLVQRSWLETYAQASGPAKPHVFLGLDAFCVRRPGVMWTGLWDLQTRRAVAVISGQRQIDVEKLLERHVQRDQVQAVVIDLAEPERQAIHTALPGAAIVADKFHVVALASQARQEVRGGKRLRGNDAWLMHRNIERLGLADAECLALILQADAVLASAWRLKEGLRAVYRARTEERAGAGLRQWLADAKASGLGSFQRIGRTLSKWDQELLNYWRFPLTKAVVEGKHNRVKALSAGRRLPQRQDLLAKDP